MSESPPPIRLLCDRCRAEGAAGEAPFAGLGDLLDFAPVPRRPRVGGWSPEVQRAFVAALAVTGSPRQAAAAVGRAAFGFGQLKKARGNAEFLSACERALALAAEKARHRLAAGVAALARADGDGPGDAPAAALLPAPPVTPADRERLLAETMQRALHGRDEPIFYAGRQVGTRRVFNDQLAMFHLRGGADSGDARPRARPSAGAGALTDGWELRVHRLLRDNPHWTRHFAEAVLRSPRSHIGKHPSPARFGHPATLLDSIRLFHQAFRDHVRADPARAAACHLLFGDQDALDDDCTFDEAFGHAWEIVECLFPVFAANMAAERNAREALPPPSNEDQP